MRYFLFVLAMLLSINGVRRLDWPTWAAITAVIAVNLLAGALIFGSGDREEPEKGG